MRRKKIYLHIGWEKTGTSARQVFLASNSDWLKGRGYLYPRMTVGPQHLELFQALNGPSPLRRHRMIRRVRDMLATTEADCVIFSHERLHVCDPALFKEMFRGHDVEVVAYLRRHDEAIVSLLATFVRWGMLRVRPRSTLPLRFARHYLGGADYVWPSWVLPRRSDARTFMQGSTTQGGSRLAASYPNFWIWSVCPIWAAPCGRILG